MSRCQKVVLADGWIVHLSVDDDSHLGVYVSNEDGTGITALDADIGNGQYEWADRFTTSAIEEAYNKGPKP